jgi:hypothetical protein
MKKHHAGFAGALEILSLLIFNVLTFSFFFLMKLESPDLALETSRSSL